MQELILELGHLGKLVLSMILGLAVGLERELHDKPAGMRTHTSVAIAGTLFAILGIEITNYYALHTPPDRLEIDPIRVIQAVVIGVSFLGAGTILKKEHTIEYLTTAAGILVTSGIGVSVGLSQYFLAVGATLAVLFVNWILKYVERRIRRRLENKATYGP